VLIVVVIKSIYLALSSILCSSFCDSVMIVFTVSVSTHLLYILCACGRYQFCGTSAVPVCSSQRAVKAFVVPDLRHPRHHRAVTLMTACVVDALVTLFSRCSAFGAVFVLMPRRCTSIAIAASLPLVYRCCGGRQEEKWYAFVMTPPRYDIVALLMFIVVNFVIWLSSLSCDDKYHIVPCVFYIAVLSHCHLCLPHSIHLRTLFMEVPSFSCPLIVIPWRAVTAVPQPR
jgi:hypothetical protein